MLELLGQRIQRRREEQKLTQSDLAHKTGIVRSYISHIETLRLLPPPEVASKIAKALGDDPEEYLKIIEQEKIIIKQRSDFERQEFSTLSYFLKRAERSFKYRGFSSIHLVIEEFEQFIGSVNRGVSFQVLLAEPTLDNLFLRAVEEGTNDPAVKRMDYIDYLVYMMDQQYLKSLGAFSFFRRVKLNQTAGMFDIRLDLSYESQRTLIIDEEFCFHWADRNQGRGWSNATVTTTGDNAFCALQTAFVEAWNRSNPLNYENIYTQYDPLSITKAKVKHLLKKHNLAHAS